ncbi:DUF7504 family protein [Halobacterium yunchengense]|uniref:DUF7504 family protein n=1 Tax=Halobacterium yunchengense TaxID=3108497 RepID=UPI003009BF30
MGGEGSRSEHVLVAGAGADGGDVDVGSASNVLAVTYRTPAEDWLGRFQAGPERVAVVSVGEQSRAATASSPGGGTDVLASTTGVVETVADAGDVAAVGALVCDYLAAWEGAGSTDVVVDDASAVLDAVSAETAFRFLHALLSRAASMDARVVAGFDASRYPPHVVQTFAPLFDDVREGA